MAVLRNINPVGAVEIPLTRTAVDAGGEFTVTADHARALLPQVSNYEPVDDEAKAIAAELAAAVETAHVEDPTPVEPVDLADVNEPAEGAE